jgi:putative transferase (TIGR04331 family)
MNRIPRTTSDFQQTSCNSHDWNANLYCEINEVFLNKNVNFKRTLRKLNDEDVGKNYVDRTKISLKMKIKQFLNMLQTQNYRIILTRPYLNKWDLILIVSKIRRIKFIDVPKSYRFDHPPISMDFEFRFPKKTDDRFSRVLEKLIPLYFPSFYLEEITNLEISSENEFGATPPRILITANSQYGDEEWKIIAARTKQNHGKIIILQHGGNYGVGSFSLIQEYELSICDHFLTWGWDVLGDKRVIIAPATKLVGKKNKLKKKN